MNWKLAAGIAIGLAALAQQLPFEPAHESGQSITGAFEGWFANPDGSISLLAGYYNRNSKQEYDIPAGPNNRIEPGGPDQGQPTHFLPGRQWGIFTIRVPKDFGGKKLAWTLIANGKATVIPMSLNPLWEVAPFRDAGGNTPPFIGFAESGPFWQGPRGQSTNLRTALGDALELTVWIADDAVNPGVGRQPGSPPVTVEWSKFRGPGAVKFGGPKPLVDKAEFHAPASTVFHGKATTTATFSEPGEYVLRVVANDWSGDGGGGFQCCWTNAYANVSVAAAITKPR
jgi:hypothetical protein